MSDISVPFPTGKFLQLSDFLKEQGSTRDPVIAIQDAVDYWLENASWKKEDLLPETLVADSARGYMWKRVFLPTGSILRMKYAGSFHYAKVEGDALVFQGENVSPNQFALTVSGTARDAWRDLWIKRPYDQDYQCADELRNKADE